MNARLVLATYNIHACIGSDGVFDPRRTACVLAELEADIVALQEVEHHRVEGGDLLDFLGRQTGMEAIAGPTLRRESRHYGNALLTRLPLRNVEPVDLSHGRREPRGALDVELDWNGNTLRVIGTHLGLRPGERRHQILKLLSVLETGEQDVAVLLGDLNEWLLWGRPLRWLRRHFAPSPNLRTWPARFPLFPLDQIWVEPGHTLSRLETHTTPLARLASDHLPLKALLAADGSVRG